jgi:putative ABC transport system ATP-binding protein
MIALSHVSMTLRAAGRPVTILDDVSLEIPDKQRIAIVGPSGSGKSTLLGLIAGLDRPTSGSIALDGTEITTLSESAMTRYRREHIGYVFQAFHLIPTLTAVENVSIPAELMGDPEAAHRAAALLDRVGLADRHHHYPVQLSGGEQQRVAVARAFVTHPRFLLADEPTGNLDSHTGRQVIDLLLELNRDQGSTLVLVTHDVELARLVERVVPLRDGRIVTDHERP